MELRTYRAASMHEALKLVRRELGPDAAVLHTREVRDRWLGLLPGRRRIEVTASRDVTVPSRLSTSRTRMPLPAESLCPSPAPRPAAPPPVDEEHFARQFQGQLSALQAMVKDLCRQTKPDTQNDWPEELFRLFTDLLDADLSDAVARELVERLHHDTGVVDLRDPMMLKARLATGLEDEIRVAGPIQVTPGRCRVAALVGPTGVGKTTTIAKLAANFRLKEKRRVGLITVDTYRIAAVEQLRTYADIIDLPMHVVSSPRDMRETVARMSHLDLILIDTAGRSPKDEVRLQELKVFLAEAGAHEVHLVLSSVAAAQTLQKTAEQFTAIGATSLLLTKLDEAHGLGNVLQLLRSSRLPVSYLTDGQSVPDDIQIADARRLAGLILQLNSHQGKARNDFQQLTIV